MRRVWVVVVVALVSMAFAPSPARSEVVRSADYVLDSPSLDEPANVKVLLPDGYDPDVDYPVLYLLHGGVGSYVDWTTVGDADAITAPYDVIVVMPDAGGGGWYSDWKNHGSGGPPRWETFHIDELIPWVDATFSTIASREGRALAGLSMGGFGAMSYAARHPDLFVAAASFSGAVDPVHASPVGFDAVQDATVMSDGGLPGSVWGSRVLDAATWFGHNPTDIAENLRSVDLFVRTGNGRSARGVPTDPIEYGCHEMSVSFHNRLVALGIDHVWDDYGAGGHTWDRWAEGLALAMPRFMSVFASPPPVPETITHVAVEPSWSVWGWSVTWDRTVDDHARLDGASAAGFTITGVGVATIVTPPFYEPGSAHTVDGVPVLADGEGRLTLVIDNGPITIDELEPSTTVVID